MFQTFKEKDKRFYDSVSKALDYNKPGGLPQIRSTIADYLKAYPNSYYSKELSEHTTKIDATLFQLDIQRKKQLKSAYSSLVFI